MATIIGVRFKNMGKVYYFDPAGNTFQKGDYAVVETARGLECGEVALANCEMDDKELGKPLKSVVRVASEADVTRMKENAEKEKSAMKVCAEKIAAHGLEMKLISAEYAFDGSKILFYFSADGRVDFRGLVKDLASYFHARIELRQIGVRDEAKMLGGLGICGQPLCCSRFLADFQPVSIKMAKEQGLSLNPTKISGTCGRLMCCLKYEQEAYSSLIKITPRQGALVNTPDGRGTVVDVNLLTGILKVRLEQSPDSPPVTLSRDDVRVITNGKPAPQKEDEEPAGEEE